MENYVTILQSENLENLDNIKTLINEQLPNPKDGKFSYDNSTSALGATDPFFSIEKPTEGNYNLDNLYDWYLTKNPEFKPVESLDIKVPEFKFITAVMAKDLLILQMTEKYPKKHKNNTKSSNHNKNIPCKAHSIDLYKKIEKDTSKSITILNLINKFIETYKYLEFLEILKHYLTLFTIGELYSEATKDICEDITIIDKLMKKPYIIYPTTLQLSYNKVIYTTQAPIINFRLSNNRKKIHNSFDSPMFELAHDIGFHAKQTHIWEQSRWNKNIFIPKDNFYKINGIIQILKPYISNINGTEPEHYNNQLLTFIIFYVIHESGNVRDLYNLNKSIIFLKNESNNNLFLEDKKLRPAVEFVINLQTKKTLNNTLQSLTQQNITLNGDAITKPIIEFILKTFNKLFISINTFIESPKKNSTVTYGGSCNKKSYKIKTKKQSKQKRTVTK